MAHFPHLNYNELIQGSGGILTYVYRWKITNWSEVQPYMEHTSTPFSADGLQWVFKFYKGRQKNPQALSLYLGILETTPGCLRGIRKKVSIIFVLENLRTKGMDFGKNSPPKINNPFDKLVNSPRFSDVTFRVIDDNSREKVFYAHKGILASSSPVFEAMLTNGMKESFEDEIKLCQANHSAFISLLTFIYTFHVNIVSLRNSENLLELADRFEIIHVREECLRYFRLELNVDNVWGIWAIAEKYCCSKTSSTCRDFVALYFDNLLDNSSTLHANPNILQLALENDEANVNSEEKIYELVVRWANHSSSLDQNVPPSENSSTIQVNDSPPPSPSTASASMPSELPENFEDLIDIDSENLYKLNNEADNDDSNKFPKPWSGDRLAALPSLLKCVRFPMMKKQFIFEEVEGNPIVMAADGMKDLVIEAYRHLLMPDVPNSTNRVKHRKRKGSGKY
ncbi:7634_t:CDS:2 [Funneliformis geosporum]|uniref:16878_t:CDS:1 n=1 Tax=Funneliformis geosporum TaxID=1117311 RepID=A0A9W4WH74_9GLOM|nr:16878_t:CDS:2 [Funneliformis geosporum]CAI2161701.1 7634_t:CDS:2 [Funneliformis geosporum]